VRGRRTALLIGLALAAAAPPAAASPPLDYQLQCRGCHGPDGQGSGGGAPPFRGQLGRFLTSPDGRVYLIRVPGVARSELDDANTAALLTWLVRRFDRDNVPPDFAPFTTAEVAAHRRPPLTDVVAERRRVLTAGAAPTR
jgi:hypothetical protein